MLKTPILNNVKILNRDHPHFPQNLKLLQNPPDIIFAIGNTSILNDLSIAIVGSRKCSNYGKECAYNFADIISSNNIKIISGLAEGIDTAAHLGSMNQKTIAVIGSGFNKIYPKSNINLINKILENDGVIISEYFFDVPAYPFNFPKRNRIVAALAAGVVVIEAAENSGALITVRIAEQLNKNIYIVPSNINNVFSKGSNALLKKNFKIALNANDILADFIDNILATPKSSKIIPNEYQSIYELLKSQPLYTSEISRILNISMTKTNSSLTLMELNEYIYKTPDGKFNIIK